MRVPAMDIVPSATKKRNRTADRGSVNDASDRAGTARDEIRRPFDTAELDSLPHPTEDDPPYRPWWVL